MSLICIIHLFHQHAFVYLVQVRLVFKSLGCISYLECTFLFLLMLNLNTCPVSKSPMARAKCISTVYVHRQPQENLPPNCVQTNFNCGVATSHKLLVSLKTPKHGAFLSQVMEALPMHILALLQRETGL